MRPISNHHIITKHLDFLKKVIQQQGKQYSQQEAEVESIYQIPVPAIEGETSYFERILQRLAIGQSEDSIFCSRIILTLALAPHIRPQFLDMLAVPDLEGGNSRNMGGLKWPSSNAFIPTVQTALFLLSENDLQRRFKLMEVFHSKHAFFQENVLELAYPTGSSNFLEQRLSVTKEFLYKALLNKPYIPDQGSDFPAKEISTKQDWEDLVLPEKTILQLEELMLWVAHNETLMEDPHLGKKLKPGYRVLLHGPPGTGKTLTASLLGKTLGKQVFRIDLSMVVSKYIGETEKNLSKLFDTAENKDWILFLTKRMLFLENVLRPKTLMTGMPIKKCRICSVG